MSDIAGAGSPSGEETSRKRRVSPVDWAVAASYLAISRDLDDQPKLSAMSVGRELPDADLAALAEAMLADLPLRPCPAKD